MVDMMIKFKYNPHKSDVCAYRYFNAMSNIKQIIKAVR